jgi:hypothetical protein
MRMLAPRPGRVRAVLDTDTYNEIDDQFALVQVMLSPDRIALEAIYAAPFHNKRSTGPGDGMDKSYDEILRLLDRMGKSPAGFVFRGVRDFVGPAKQARKAEAVDHLIARARETGPDDPLFIIAIAAISNVASALLAAPDIADKVIVVWLGGHALEWPDTREFNLRQDVGGAQVVLDSRVPLVLIPCMGVTSHLHSTVPEIECCVEPQGEIGRFLAERFKGYSDDHFGWSKEIWDMAPVGWLINPDWAPTVLAPTPILTDHATWSVDRSRHAMRYATMVKRDPILKDFFSKLKLFAAKRNIAASQGGPF